MLPIKRCALSASVLFLLLPARRQRGNVNNLCMLCLHDMQMIPMYKTKFEVSKKNVPTRGPLSSQRQSDKTSNIISYFHRTALVTQRAMEVWAKKALSQLSLLPIESTNQNSHCKNLVRVTYLQDIPELPPLNMTPLTCQSHKHTVSNTVFSVNPFIKLLRLGLVGLGLV